MSAVSSSGSEPFVLARRGLPFAASTRLFAPAPWFASFAFARSRVPPRPGAQAMPGMELPSALPNETEEDPYENLLGGDDPWRDTETAPVHASVQGPASMATAGARASEISARVELKTQVGLAAPFPRRSAPPDDILAQRAQAVVGARPAEAAWNDPPSAKTAPVRAPLGVERPATGQAASRMSQATPRPSLDQAPREASPVAGLYDDATGTKGYSRAPLGVTPSMERSPGVGLDDPPSKRPPRVHLPVSEPSASRTATTPVAAGLSVRQATSSGKVSVPQKIVAPVAAPTQGFASRMLSPPSEGGAPASFATLMGTPHAAPPGSDSSAVASRTEIAQLAERSRATVAANAGGHVTHRIGTVQVVVQSIAPPARAAPGAPRAPGPSHAATAREPVRRAFRNPWTSSRWRGE